MKIKTVKYSDGNKDGVIITFQDGTSFQIPTQAGKYRYTDILNEWLKDESHTIAPWRSEIELNEELNQGKIREAKEYLDATDFFFVRRADTGEGVPTDVQEQRIKHRDFLKSVSYSTHNEFKES